MSSTGTAAVVAVSAVVTRCTMLQCILELGKHTRTRTHTHLFDIDWLHLTSFHFIWPWNSFSLLTWPATPFRIRSLAWPHCIDLTMEDTRHKHHALRFGEINRARWNMAGFSFFFARTGGRLMYSSVCVWLMLVNLLFLAARQACCKGKVYDRQTEAPRWAVNTLSSSFFCSKQCCEMWAWPLWHKSFLWKARAQATS